MVLVGQSRLRSSHGQDHFEVKVIQESNCKHLEFYPKVAAGFRLNVFLFYFKFTLTNSYDTPCKSIKHPPG